MYSHTRGAEHSTFIFLRTFWRNSLASSVWRVSAGGNYRRVSYCSCQAVVDAHLLAGSFLECRDHFDALPWPGPIDLVLFTGLCGKCGLVGALNLEDELRDHLLRHLDDVVVICIGHVELNGLSNHKLATHYSCGYLIRTVNCLGLAISLL